MDVDVEQSCHREVLCVVLSDVAKIVSQHSRKGVRLKTRMNNSFIIISISSVCGVCGGVQRHTCVSPPTGSHPSAQYSRRCSEWTLLV